MHYKYVHGNLELLYICYRCVNFHLYLLIKWFNPTGSLSFVLTWKGNNGAVDISSSSGDINEDFHST